MKWVLIYIILAHLAAVAHPLRTPLLGISRHKLARTTIAPKELLISASLEDNSTPRFRSFHFRGGYTGLNAVSSVSFLSSIQLRFIMAVLVNGCAAAILTAKKQKSLTREGLLHSMGLGIGLWTFLGVSGWSIGVTFLILGSLVTKLKLYEKEKLGIAEKRGGARAPENVWGSAAMAMSCAIVSYFIPPWSEAFRVAFVASFATKLADTCSSEIGKAYGKTAYLITSWKQVPRGTEGAVSVEGTIAGIGGGFFMAFLALWFGVIHSWRGLVATVVASVFATTIESYIGAVFQNNVDWLSNEMVNFIMTVIGGISSILLYGLLSI